MTTTYVTTKKVLEFLRWNKKIPTFVSGETPVLETVDSSGALTATDVIYLDHNNVIDDTLTLSYGSSTTATQTTLIDDTDYTVIIDDAKVTLNSSGTNKIGSNSVFATYEYTDMLPDSVLADMINRAEKWVEETIDQQFGTSYIVTREEQPGRGAYDRLYRPLKLLPQIYKSQLSADIATATTAIPVDSTEGLRANDILTMGTETLKATSITSSTSFVATRGYFGTSVIASHSENDWLVNLVFEISNTTIGSNPNYHTLEFRNKFDIDSDTGAVQLMHINAEDKDDLSPEIYPLLKLFNRIRMTYRAGTLVVPKDMEKLVILVTARDLMNMSMSKALPEGIDGFNPTVIDKIDEEIKKLIRERKILLTRAF